MRNPAFKALKGMNEPYCCAEEKKPRKGTNLDKEHGIPIPTSQREAVKLRSSCARAHLFLS